MSAQEREWQPGDKAYVEVEVIERYNDTHFDVQISTGGASWLMSVAASSLRPVPAGGEVEAAVRLVVGSTALGVEQAREYLTAALELVRAGEVEAVTEDVSERAREIIAGALPLMPEYVPGVIVRDLATAGLLAGGVPGRSEAEIKAEGATWDDDTIHEAWWTAMEAGQLPRPRGASIAVRDAFEVGWKAAMAARVAGTTDTEGSE